jgi:hypothetical protein
MVKDKMIIVVSIVPHNFLRLSTHSMVGFSALMRIMGAWAPTLLPS